MRPTTRSRHALGRLRLHLHPLIALWVILSLALPSNAILAASPSEANFDRDSNRRDQIVSATPTSTPSFTPTAPDSIETPTETPALSETPPSATPTEESTETPTPLTTATPTSSATLRANASATSTPVDSLTPALAFAMTVSPEQVASGEAVTFTVTISNTSAVTATNIVFTNVLPEEFSKSRSGFQGFEFDPQTRTLRTAGITLGPGEKIALEYTARLAPQAEEGRIIDTASVTAEGLADPIAAEATLTILQAGQHLTSLGPSGGQASGLNGRVRIKVPRGLLADQRAIAISDLKDSYPAADGQPWTAFSLEMQAEVTQDLSAPLGTEHDQRVRLSPVEAKFDEPVELIVSFDGLTDLATLGADRTPFIATLDETSGTWVRVPLTAIDRKVNTVTAKIQHFSTWGAGLGPSFPQNGANVLLFDSAQPDTFTGRSRFSLPLWTPPGRNGMSPSLALSYSSSNADGVLGDVQAPWTGMGWNVDSVEIARKITNGPCNPCGNGYYGYKNEFILLFNGIGGELIQEGTTGRYHTKDESFLYIQLHNTSLGNNSPLAQNSTGEWWEVVTRDGTRWRLGWNADSEQLAAMLGYPGNNTGAWTALGYAGHAPNVVAARWRADKVTDTHGNIMTFSYSEETRTVIGTSNSYDRASYLDTVSYGGHTSGTPAAGYSVVFVRESRNGVEVPTPQYDWDNWDTYRLDKIQVKYGAAVVRTHDLNFGLRSYSDDGKTWDTTVLNSVAITGTVNSLTTTMPIVTFNYADKDNRANCGSGCQEWAYPRLDSLANGWGATVNFTYANDDRTDEGDWYNWRVEALTIHSGVANGSPMQTAFAYSGPCYKDGTLGWCHPDKTGELVGYAQTTVTTKDFDGSPLAITLHKFYTDEQHAGREYETQNQDASGTILAKTTTAYTVVTSGLPATGYYIYASAEEAFIRSGAALTRLNWTEYVYDTTTGNLTSEKLYHGATLSLYRSNNYEYQTNTSPSVWILDRVKRKTLKDAAGNILAEQRYGYDGNAPGSGTLGEGELTLNQIISGTQAINTAYLYDAYGNLKETYAFENYGTPGAMPSGSFRTTRTTYDTALYTYPITSTQAVSSTTVVSQTTITNYNYALGLPTSVKDANNNTTTTTYDALGRVTEVKYPGYGQANIKYIYPTPSGGAIPAPFALQLQAWDEPFGAYRSAWAIYDGLGRTLQTQGLDEAGTGLIIADVRYNALGQTHYTGQPRSVAWSGGTYFAPNWLSLPHTTTTYDALGRLTRVDLPDESFTTTSYDGLRTTSVDQNQHQRVQENDPFGRLVKVEEYTGANPYTLYATTTYQYDPRDLLTLVTDAKGNQTQVTYNALGRKVAMDDPDMGNWSYGYDLFGNLTSQTDARGTTLSFEYDALNRQKKKWQGLVGTGTLLATFTYDAGTNGVGRRTSMTTPAAGAGSGTASWAYNAFGQVISETHTISGAAYTTQATFDAFGRTLTQTYPSNETLTFNYNAQGTLASLSSSLGSTYVSNVHYNANGQTTSLNLGNGVLTTNTYNALTNRLTSAVSAKIPQNPLLNLAYTYDPAGNVTQINDATRYEVTDYSYDSLDRLVSASATHIADVIYQRTYSYDTLGNIIAVGRWPNAGNPNLNFGSLGSAALATNGSRNRLTAFSGVWYTGGSQKGGSVSAFTASGLGPQVTNQKTGRSSFAGGALATNSSRNSVTAFTGGSAVLPFTKGFSTYNPPPPGPPAGWAYTTYTYGDPNHAHAVTSLSTGETYQYDANGNMTLRVENGKTYTQTFDAENRLISVAASIGGTTQFVYDGDGNLIKKVKPDNTATVYLGSIYEVQLNAAGAVTQTTSYYSVPGARITRVNGTVSYLLADHLGSASVALDSSGNVTAEKRYYAFGETRVTSGTMPTDKLFTGQREMADIGLYHYGARFYSSTLGRFISADTVVPNWTSPQTLNRYSYVLNNPLKYTDPTGHCVVGGHQMPDTSPACAGSTGGGGGSGSSGGNPCNYTPVACVGGGGGNSGGGGSSSGSGGGGSQLWESSPVNPCVASPSPATCEVSDGTPPPPPDPRWQTTLNTANTVSEFLGILGAGMEVFPKNQYIYLRGPAVYYPVGYGQAPELQGVVIPTRFVIYDGKIKVIGTTLGNVLVYAGAVLAVAPNQISDYNSHASVGRHAADLAIDGGGYIISAIAGIAIGVGFFETGPGAFIAGGLTAMAVNAGYHSLVDPYRDALAHEIDIQK